MLTEQQYNSFHKLFKAQTSKNAGSTLPIAASGSNRVYYRLLTAGEKPSYIAAYNPDRNENKAFIHIAEAFEKAGINAPIVCQTDQSGDYYLQSDLGDDGLYDLIKAQGFTPLVKNYYKQCLTDLLNIQFKIPQFTNASVFYPRPAFDRQSMQWDLNYFKYNFLKLAHIPFDESNLENDFSSLLEVLDALPRETFLFRDFKSKNIMVKDDALYYIDFQGGRLGNYYYDVASLLFEGIVNMPESLREELLKFYHRKLQAYTKIDWKTFEANFYQVLLVRLLQALGAYGYRGLFEKKATFLQSIPPMQDTLKWLLDHSKIPNRYTELSKVLRLFVEHQQFTNLKSETPDKLTIAIKSFSFKKDYPIDSTGNGGGFVFDCRNLTNPGRIEQYKMLNGTHHEVKLFLQQQPEVDTFLESAYSLVSNAIEVYLKKGFKHLQVNFGCTGGQHRSVYCAEWISSALRKRQDVNINLIHREQKNE